ncbi:MAG: UbiD family decarboxylase [Candidatus Hadarchaeales archaeon]
MGGRMSLREFVERLERKGLLLKVKREVSPRYEITSLLLKAGEKPVKFEKVKGSPFPLVSNVCASRELVALALGVKPSDLLRTLLKAIENPKEPERMEAREYRELPPDLRKLPILLHYPFDGGKYITGGIVVAEDPELGINLSFHRMMVVGKDRVVMRILPRHFHTFLERGLKEFAVCIGCDVHVLLSAATSLELGRSELGMASALRKTKVVELGGLLVPEAEMVMIMEMTGEEREEGPFLDLTGTLDMVRKQKVARVKKLFVKEEALYHAILPAGPEHKILMGMPREPTIFREVNKVCECKDVYLTPGGCSWLHAVVSIKKRKPDDGKKAIEAAFRGHSSLKHVWVVDEDINPRNPEEVEWAMATRFQGDRGMVVKKERGSSLDPSADPETGLTTKVGFDLTIPPDRPRSSFLRPRR